MKIVDGAKIFHPKRIILIKSRIYQLSCQQRHPKDSSETERGCSKTEGTVVGQGTDLHREVDPGYTQKGRWIEGLVVRRAGHGESKFAT